MTHVSDISREINKMVTSERIKKNLLLRIRRYFIAGILLIAPLSITAVTLLYAFRFLDSFAGLGKFIQDLTGFRIPGVGILLTLILVTILGYLTTNVIGKNILLLWERFIARVPILSTIYQASKELFTAIFTQRKQRYKKVVLIEYPRKKLWVIAFVTNEETLKVEGEQMLSVFIPTTPNPTSGMLVFMHESECLLTDLTIEEAIKLIVSGAIITPPGRIDFSRTADIKT